METDIFHLMVHSANGCSSSCCRADLKSGARVLCQSPTWMQDQGIEHSLLPFQVVSRELDHKGNSWDINW